MTLVVLGRANTACTQLVGLAAYSGNFLAWSWFRKKGVVSSRPPAGNASRWAASGVDLLKRLILKTKTSKGLKVFVAIIDQAYKTGQKMADDFKQNMRIVLMTFFQLGIIGASANPLLISFKK